MSSASLENTVFVLNDLLLDQLVKSQHTDVNPNVKVIVEFLKALSKVNAFLI